MNPFDLKSVLLARHAQHVVLIHFPIALFLVSVAFDFAAQWKRNTTLATVAYYNLTVAAISSLPVVATGLDNKDFEKLAVPLLDGLYNFACWLSGDPDEARDLVQETFLKSLRGFASFREGTNFRAWMFRILRNTFLTSRTGLERRNTRQEDEEGFEESAVTQE